MSLLQTHQASRGARRSNGTPLLRDQVKALLPTPSASGDARNTNQTSDYQCLAQSVNLLPTPMSSTYEQGGDGGELRAAITHGPTRRLLPTPCSQNGETRNSKTWVRPLDEPQNLENALARLPGDSTSPPSGNGNTSSDDPHPGQLTIEDA